jgi:hypothetical protein
MESVFNIHPNNIKILPIINNNQYSFLNNIFDINIQPYYDLLNSIENFKIKNIYHFLYLRSILIDRKFKNSPIKEKIIPLSKNFNDFNDSIQNYIQNDQFKAILIINGIQQYFFPIKY